MHAAGLLTCDAELLHMRLLLTNHRHALIIGHSAVLLHFYTHVPICKCCRVTFVYRVDCGWRSVILNQLKFTCTCSCSRGYIRSIKHTVLHAPHMVTAYMFLWCLLIGKIDTFLPCTFSSERRSLLYLSF